ncbi:MAG: hypothetical protein GY850_19925 [bacterium]|nr:hypothetical protein [bacterium]
MDFSRLIGLGFGFIDKDITIRTSAVSKLGFIKRTFINRRAIVQLSD